jgi:antitoxin component YwqK of YwqJK toxin-antitoxin module
MSTPAKVEVISDDSQLNASLIKGLLQGPARITQGGRPQAILSYNQGQLEGPMVIYHPNGQPSARLNYRQNKLDGLAVFHSSQGALIREAQYRAGLMHGGVTSYFEDGTLASREHYRQGQLQGLYQRFHGNGRLAARIEYEKGKALDGAGSFAVDGRPLEASGKPVSRWKAWWLRWRQAPDE